MSMFNSVLLVAGQIQAEIPNPVPTAPPGSNGLTTILGWIAWIIFGLAVAAILIVAGKMMFDHRNGQGGGQAATGLIWVMAGAIVAAVASGLVGAIVTAAGGTA